MSANQEDTRNLVLLGEVMEQVRAISEYDEKHLRRTVGVKLVVVAVVALYLGWAYVNVRSIDADLVVFSAVERVNEAIPTAKQRAVEHLTEIAPAVVDQAAEQALKNLPDMEKTLEENAKAALIALADSQQKDLLAWISEFIAGSKAVVDENFPGASSYEKISAMRKYVLEDVQESLKGVSYQIGEDMRDNSIAPDLQRLLTGKNLSEKEKLQRDIIALAYLLVQQNLDDLGV